MLHDAVDQKNIEATNRLIGPYIRTTPTVRVDASEFEIGKFPIWLKLELMQHAGSFKTRGAFTNLLSHTIPSAGVVAASGGNHGAAVAFAAMRLGVRARIFVPNISSPEKLRRIKQYGAELVVGGDRYSDALAACEDWLAQSNAMSVHAFDQTETMLGQGTIGLEFQSQVPDIDTLLVSIGGGGLIAGIAAWYGDRIKIVGVEPKTSPTLTMALAAGRPVAAETEGLAADSLAPSHVGEKVFPIARRYVNQVVLVEDDAIRNAQRALWEVLRVVAEPGGCASFAALLSEAYSPRPDERVGVLISGGNTTAVEFSQ